MEIYISLIQLLVRVRGKGRPPATKGRMQNLSKKRITIPVEFRKVVWNVFVLELGRAACVQVGNTDLV